MKTKLKIFYCLIVTIMFMFTVTACNLYHGSIENYTVGDGESLKVGIISDIHMPANKNDEDYISNFESTLKIFKENNIDVLIIAGDFTDLATRYAYSKFNEIYDKVYGNDKPIASFVMGNHDYWLKFGATVPTMRARFTRYTGEKPFTHKVINGYHFIGWSSENGTYDKAHRNEKWIREAIERAIADNPDNPVFVTTHIHPENTVYGSADWGNSDITNVLKDYHQVVAFSGHSHYSLIDERSIYQGDFTAINTQSLTYIELDEGYENGSIPRNEYDCSSVSKLNPMALIMNIEKSEITIDRISILDENVVKEPWIIPLPISKDTFKYTLEKQNVGRSAPIFPENRFVTVEKAKNIHGNDINVLSFEAALHSDFVHTYKLVFSDESGIIGAYQTDGRGQVIKYDTKGKRIPFNSRNYSKGEPKLKTEFYYYSDFYNGLENMADIVRLRLPYLLQNGEMEVSIYAMDSFGNTSDPLISTINV